MDTTIFTAERTNTGEFLFRGPIDSHAEAALKEIPARITGKSVTIDFHHTGRINSMGIAQLLRCFKAIRDERQAEIRVRGLSTMNALLFKMTGLFLLATPMDH